MDAIPGLTVGQVSGLIAFGTTTIAFTAPLVLGVILACYFGQEASAATWSVVARQLHSTAWPTFLGSDSAAVEKVDIKATLVAYTSFSFVFLVALASVVTPIGLREEAQNTGQQNVSFVYIQDDSTFGRNTRQRPPLGFFRNCTSNSSPFPCPGVDLDGVLSSYSSENLSSVSETGRGAKSFTTRMEIPRNITNFFTSASRSSTVAGPFDIQFRSWRTQKTSVSGTNTSFTVGLQRTIDVLIPKESVTLVEGLIVDLETGGVGIRNHSVPSQAGAHTTWEEDILWIEPEIVCESTNLSISFSIAYNKSGAGGREPLEVFLVDNGGFSVMQPDASFGFDRFPALNSSSPNLEDRLKLITSAHNSFLSTALNVTQFKGSNVTTRNRKGNITINSEYPLSSFGGVIGRAVLPIGVSAVPLHWLRSDFGLPRARFMANYRVIKAEAEILEPAQDYPYLETIAKLSDIDRWCTGELNNERIKEEVVKYVNSNVKCSYFLGMPQRANGGSSLEEELGEKWRTPLNICAGAVKASIKKVTFMANGSSFDNIYVTSVIPKDYTSSQLPLWAMENFHSPLSIGATKSAIWGIVDPSLDATPGYNFTRSATFYLPSAYPLYQNEPDPSQVYSDNLAAAIAPFNTLDGVMKGTLIENEYSPYMPSYRGTNNLALRSRWESLSGTADGAARVLALVWTDVFANIVVGTRSRAAEMRPDGVEYEAVPGLVSVFERRVAYDVRFAVPAVLLAALWVVVVVGAGWSAVVHGSTPGRMKRLLNDTSLGRVIVESESVELSGGKGLGTKAWLANFGGLKVGLRKKDVSDKPESEDRAEVLETYEKKREKVHGMAVTERLLISRET